MFAYAQFRFYEELNDFLPAEKKKIDFSHRFQLGASVKDIIESLGVPHTEVDLILINGESVTFKYTVKAEDYVSVYPMFESFDISKLTHLRPQALRQTRFILDVHLGKLAKRLRLLGFDTSYANTINDADIILKATQEKRIILTRDIGILKQKKVTHGYFIRSIESTLQTQEVLNRFDLACQCKPFSRCLVCNTLLQPLHEKDGAFATIPDDVKAFQDEFFYCPGCARNFWQGTHYEKLAAFVNEVLTPNV